MPDYSRALALHSALTKLGVPSMTAVGVVGSLAGESGLGLNPKSRNPGDGADGSDSLNFGQWNGPRARALIQAAQQNGLAPDSFDAGMLHMKNELTGPYSKVLNALKAKDDPNYGADVWTRQYEVPGNVDAEVRRRQGLAQQFAGILGSKGAPVTSSTEAPQDDVAASQAVLKSVPSDIQASAAAPESESTWDRVQKEGLAGLVSKDWNLGDALMGSGVAMMAHSNPNGAAALSALMKNLNDKNKAKDKIDLKWLPDRNGNKMLGVDPNTGETKAVKDLTPDAPDNSLPQKLQQMYQGNVQNLQKGHDFEQRLNHVQEGLASGKFSMSMDQQGKFAVQNLTNSSAEDAQYAKEATAMVNSMIEDIMNANKGVGTKWKAELAKHSLLPSGGEYDNAQTLDALDRIREWNRTSRIYPNATNLRTLEGSYGDISKQARDADNNTYPSWGALADQRAQKQKEYEDTTLRPKIEEFQKNRKAQQAQPAANPNNDKKSSKSFKDYMLSQ